MHGAGGIKPLLVVVPGDAERSEANAGRLDVREDERGGGREDVGAFAHLIWTARIHATCAGRGHVVVHGIAAQLGKTVTGATENCLLCGTEVDFSGANIARERGFLWIDQEAGITKTGSVTVNRGIDPTKSARIVAPQIEDDVTAVVIHIHHPGEVELLVIIDATGAVSLSFGFGECGEEKAREDGNNGNDDEQLDESERGACSRCNVHGEPSAG